jgi:hypothetical protein
MDRRIIRAARNALGYDVGEDRVAQAIATHEASDTRTLRHQLKERVAIFEAAGAVESNWPRKLTASGSPWRPGGPIPDDDTGKAARRSVVSRAAIERTVDRTRQRDISVAVTGFLATHPTYSAGAERPAAQRLSSMSLMT